MSAWKSLSEFENATLFGAHNETAPGDLTQGMIKDCFFIAGASAMALDSPFTKALFLPAPYDNITKVQDYKFEMFVVGRKFEIIVDDTMPVF